MIDGCGQVSSECLVIEKAPFNQLFTFVEGFEKCLRIAREILIIVCMDRFGWYMEILVEEIPGIIP